MYEYRAQVTSVYDGDTFRADVDLGFRIWLKAEAFRLYRIDAPEMKGADLVQGRLSKAAVLTQMQPHATIYLRTQKDAQEKYGRYLVDVYPSGFNGPCLNDLLVREGWAVYWDGSGPRP